MSVRYRSEGLLLGNSNGYSVCNMTYHKPARAALKTLAKKWRRARAYESRETATVRS